MNTKSTKFLQRKRRVRTKVFGTEARPRLAVSKSNLHIYAQLINDAKGVTLVSSSDMMLKKADKMTKVQVSEAVGEDVAKKAVAKKIKKVTFDRSGFIYHGRVKALADGARKGGLEF